MKRFDIVPVPKPRMTRSDAWKKRPAVLRYFAYKDALRALYGAHTVPPVIELDFILPMPNSWSEKKKAQMDGKPHQQKPDWDNLSKAWQDALCDDDSYVYDAHCRKFWGRTGAIIDHTIK